MSAETENLMNSRICQLLLAAAGAAVVVTAAACGTQSMPHSWRSSGDALPALLAHPVGRNLATVPPGAVSEFPIPTASSFPTYITTASDGDLWFSEGPAGKIGRITTAGVITEFSAGVNPYDITRGPDGRPWFASPVAGMIGTVSTVGVVSLFAIPTAGSHPEQLVADTTRNAIWVTERNGPKIAKFSLATKTFKEFPLPTGRYGPARPVGIALDANGHLWFSDFLNDQVDEMSATGSILHTLALPGIIAAAPGPTIGGWYMTLGPDNNVWLAELAGGTFHDGAVAKINPTTLVINTYTPPTRLTGPVDIASGPKGMWFDEDPTPTGQLGRISLTGTIDEFLMPGTGAVYGVTEGPDGNIWFTDFIQNEIGRLDVSQIP